MEGTVHWQCQEIKCEKITFSWDFKSLKRGLGKASTEDEVEWGRDVYFCASMICGRHGYYLFY